MYWYYDEILVGQKYKFYDLKINIKIFTRLKDIILFQ